MAADQAELILHNATLFHDISVTASVSKNGTDLTRLAGQQRHLGAEAGHRRVPGKTLDPCWIISFVRVPSRTAHAGGSTAGVPGRSILRPGNPWR